MTFMTGMFCPFNMINWLELQYHRLLPPSTVIARVDDFRLLGESPAFDNPLSNSLANRTASTLFRQQWHISKHKLLQVKCLTHSEPNQLHSWRGVGTGSPCLTPLFTLIYPDLPTLRCVIVPLYNDLIYCSSSSGMPACPTAFIIDLWDSESNTFAMSIKVTKLHLCCHVRSHRTDFRIQTSTNPSPCQNDFCRGERHISNCMANTWWNRRAMIDAKVIGRYSLAVWLCVTLGQE